MRHLPIITVILLTCLPWPPMFAQPLPPAIRANQPSASTDVFSAPSVQPRSVSELWAGFDPRKDPLETELLREWRTDGMVLRYVRFLVGTFKGKPARLAAFYGFPEGGHNRLPAIMHIHGGGQRADINEVKVMAARGYAALSVNWGGREMEGAKPGDLNTDWGAVDPTQNNVPGYFSMAPGPRQYYDTGESPKNCNWYLLTLACRRGLTFLEQQPEVDPTKLGVHGLSMGGNLTMYVAGTDSRVKAAVPAVGGQGWRWEPHTFEGGSTQQEHIQGDLELFKRTLSFESYASNIHCPLMHRSATNDFHGWMDDVYRTDALIKGRPVQHSWSPHLNHRFTPEVAVTMPLWFDHYLKGGPALPETPQSTLILNTSDHTTVLRVTPKSPWQMRCEIYYSIDPDPRARFWRSADVVREGDQFTAMLPIETVNGPLFAFANVYYTLPKPERLPQLPEFQNSAIRELCISSALHSMTAAELTAAHIKTQSGTSSTIDDFSHGWHDWYQLNAGNPDHWQNWTRKITDPKWRGADGSRLCITLQIAQTNRIAFVVIENEWRDYRGPRRTYVCEKVIPGNTIEQTILLDPSEFKEASDGAPLKSWSMIDELGIGARTVEMNVPPTLKVPAAQPWRGDLPQFKRLEWK